MLIRSRNPHGGKQDMADNPALNFSDQRQNRPRRLISQQSVHEIHDFPTLLRAKGFSMDIADCGDIRIPALANRCHQLFPVYVKGDLPRRYVFAR